MSDTNAWMDDEDFTGALDALITAAREGGMFDEQIVAALTHTAGTLRDGMSSALPAGGAGSDPEMGGAA
jgi:hypothetical protein